MDSVLSETIQINWVQELEKMKHAVNYIYENDEIHRKKKLKVGKT